MRDLQPARGCIRTDSGAYHYREKIFNVWQKSDPRVLDLLLALTSGFLPLSLWLSARFSLSAFLSARLQVCAGKRFRHVSAVHVRVFCCSFSFFLGDPITVPRVTSGRDRANTEITLIAFNKIF